MRLADEILNLIFPNTCALCGKVEKEFLCKECIKKIELKSEPKVRLKINKNNKLLKTKS